MSDMFDDLMNKPSEEEPVQEPQVITDEEVASAKSIDDEPAVLGAGVGSFEPVETPEPAELTGLAAVYAEKEEGKQKAKCLEEIGKILKKYDGKESDVPLNHEYWDLTALYRKLNANP